MAKRFMDQRPMRIMPTKVYAARVGAGWDGVDDTATLQAAIDTGAGEVIVEAQAGPWVVSKLLGAHTYGILLRSNQTLRFLPGADVIAKAGSFTAHLTDSLFATDGSNNVKVIGNGVTWTMLRAEFAPTNESHHGLRIANSNGVFVSGLTIKDCPGDGIYIGGTLPTNITIQNTTCENNNRNNMSITNVDGCLIQDVTLTNANGADPETGLDIEPNAGQQISNLVLRRVHTSGNARGGLYLQLAQMTSSEPDIGILIEDYDSTADSDGLTGIRPAFYAVTANATPPGGSIVINGMTITDSLTRAVGLRGKPADGPTLELHDILIVNPGGIAAQKPIMFESGTGNLAALSGFVLDNVIVQDAIDRTPMNFINGAAVPIYNITGEVTVTYTVTPVTTVYPLASAILKTWLGALYEDAPP